MQAEPWICPKCGRVWGPGVVGCQVCNVVPVPERQEWMTARCPACGQIYRIGQGHSCVTMTPPREGNTWRSDPTLCSRGDSITFNRDLS